MTSLRLTSIPELPPEEWDLSHLMGKVKEFVYLLEDLEPQLRCRVYGMEELKAFLQEQLRVIAYDLKEAEIEQLAQV